MHWADSDFLLLNTAGLLRMLCCESVKRAGAATGNVLCLEPDDVV